jgi:hypothetical protein
MTSETTAPAPAPATTPDLRWEAALRAEEWAGEVRVNLIRLAAIVAFYGHHVVNYYLRRLEFPASYHLEVTIIASAWALGAAAIHVALARRWKPPSLKYGAVTCDYLLATSLLIFSGGPGSPFLVILPLLIATSALRLNLRLVWASTALALVSYGFLCGHSRWVKPEFRVPVREHVIFALALAVAGVLAGQVVRQARRLCRDYVDRLEAAKEETAS